MNKKEILLKILKNYNTYTLVRGMGINYDELVENMSHYNNKKIMKESSWDIILNHPQFNAKILKVIFALEEHDGLTQDQIYYVADPKTIYDQLLILLEKEEEINKIFKESSVLMSNTQEGWAQYRNRYARFLGEIISRSTTDKNVQEMFEHFKEMRKSDETDFYPIVKSFLDKKISADLVYDSIKKLDNSYLETRMVEYLYKSGISFYFKLKFRNV